MTKDFYSQQGIITEPGEFRDRLQDLPPGIPELVKIVQGLLIHVFWAERYGLKLTEERQQEVQLRRVQNQLNRIFELDQQPLTVARPVEKRLVGNCRDFSVLLCSLLRDKGIPARARCGFGAYFRPGKFEDHWVCEYWDSQQNRWRLVDAQLDELQKQALAIEFDTLDVPRDQFIVGGKAWQWCRQNQANPDDFGIADMKGLWFIRGNLVRDIAALNKVELLPWDSWGAADCQDSQLTEEDLELLDRGAELTMPEVVNESQVRGLYRDSRLTVPEKFNSYTVGGVAEISL